MRQIVNEHEKRLLGGELGDKLTSVRLPVALVNEAKAKGWTMREIFLSGIEFKRSQPGMTGRVEELENRISRMARIMDNQARKLNEMELAALSPAPPEAKNAKAP